MCARLISAMVFLFVLASSLEVRPVAIWSYEMLLEKSDAVLIGKVDSAKAFDEKLDDRSFGNVLDGQITTFKVRVVLKGKANVEKIELVHYLVNPDKPMVNGPLSAYFRVNGQHLTITAVDGVAEKQERQEASPDYLLFLKSRKDGRFEPVTGQVDSSFSVRKVTPAD